MQNNSWNFITFILKALWDGQGKIKMYNEMSMVTKQLSGKGSIRSLPMQVTFPCLFAGDARAGVK